MKNRRDDFVQNKQKIIVIYVIIMNCNVNGIIVYFNNITKIHVVYKKGGKYEEEFQERTGYGDRDDNGYFIGCVFPKDCP